MSYPKVLLYGAYGYTGKLIAQKAAEFPMELCLAGRDHKKIASLASALKLPHLVIDLAEKEKLEGILDRFDLVIHAAGPYKYTAIPMVEACIKTKTHYVDITGEWQVFQAISKYHEQASDAGIVLLPGAGFDVVPSDCLAAHAKSLLPDATRLTLAFQGVGSPSRGTTLTALEYASEGSVVREHGKIISSPMGEKISVDFGQGDRDCIGIPWGDVVTAWHSTGIPNIAVYMSASPKMQANMKKSKSWAGWIKGPIKSLAKWWVKKNIDGPDASTRNEGKSYLYAQVKNAAGDTAIARLQTMEAYQLTALCALMAADNILNTNRKGGFYTPATAFGKEFILKVPGSTFY